MDIKNIIFHTSLYRGFKDLSNEVLFNLSSQFNFEKSRCPLLSVYSFKPKIYRKKMSPEQNHPSCFKEFSNRYSLWIVNHALFHWTIIFLLLEKGILKPQQTQISSIKRSAGTNLYLRKWTNACLGCRT